MSEKKSCTGRDSAEAYAAIFGYTDSFWAIENRWHLRLARKLFPVEMARRDARVQKEFVEDMKKFKKRVAHAAKGKV